MLVDQWNKYINFNGDYMEKLYSSAGNICTMFYLNSNKHVGLVNACTLFFRHPIYMNLLILVKPFCLLKPSEYSI